MDCSAEDIGRILKETADARSGEAVEHLGDALDCRGAAGVESALKYGNRMRLARWLSYVRACRPATQLSSHAVCEDWSARA